MITIKINVITDMIISHGFDHVYLKRTKIM